MIPENIGLNISIRNDCHSCCPRKSFLSCCCCSDDEEIAERVSQQALKKFQKEENTKAERRKSKLDTSS